MTFLDPGSSQMGKKESLADTAKVLGRMYDGIEYRGFKQSVVEDLARYSGVPVWNGLTDMFPSHPDAGRHHDRPRGVRRSARPQADLLRRRPQQRGQLPDGPSAPSWACTSAPCGPQGPDAFCRAGREVPGRCRRDRRRAGVHRRREERRRELRHSSTPTSGSPWASPTRSGPSASSFCCPTR